MNKICKYNNDENPVNKNERCIYKKTRSETEHQIDIDIENLELIRNEKRKQKLQIKRQYWQKYKEDGRIKKTSEQKTSEQKEAKKKYLIEYQRKKHEVKKSADILNKMNDTKCNDTKCNDTKVNDSDFFLYFIKAINTMNDKPLFI